MSSSTITAHWTIAGATIGFELPAAVLDEIERVFAPLTLHEEHATVPRVWYRERAGSSGVTRIERLDALRTPPVEPIGSSAQDLIDDLHLTIALHSRDHVFVHAGVVTWNGSAILIPGRSHTGKSTLVEELVRQGAGYCSDEYARVGEDGSITPYARAIQLRVPGGSRRSLDASDIGIVDTGERLAPSLVVFTWFAEGAEFRPVRVAPAAAALELFDNTVIAETEPDRATQVVAQIARRARAVKSARPDAATAASDILALADRLEVAS